MTAKEGRSRPNSHDTGAAADARAAALAALSDELAQRLSRHPLPPPHHRLRHERSRRQVPWRSGLLWVLGVAAVAGLAVAPSGMIGKALENFSGRPADASIVASPVLAVSTATAATATPPQSATPPAIDAPPITAAPVKDRTAASSRVDDLQSVDERELTWAEVHELQVRLHALKYDPGPLDGIKGPLTRAAVRRFQESQGDPATGDIGMRTLVRLRQATGAPDRKPL